MNKKKDQVTHFDTAFDDKGFINGDIIVRNDETEEVITRSSVDATPMTLCSSRCARKCHYCTKNETGWICNYALRGHAGGFACLEEIIKAKGDQQG